MTIRISATDEAVLEYLHRYRNPRDPKEIASALDVNPHRVRHRLPKLAEAGYVEKVAEGRGISPSTWTLTEHGRARVLRSEVAGRPSTWTPET